MTTHRLTLAALMLAPFVALAGGADQTETVGANRTITVSDRNGVAAVATRSADADAEGTPAFVEISDGASTRSVESIALSFDTIEFTYSSDAGEGSIIVQDGRVLRDSLPRGAVDDAEATLALVVSIQESPSDYTYEPWDPTVEINWECEIATLKVIYECGTFDVDGCGDAVQEQFCACVAQTPDC